MGDISRSVNGENVLGGVAYKNKYTYVVCVGGGAQATGFSSEGEHISV